MRTFPTVTVDDKFVIGHIVTGFVCAGGRRPHDGEYMTALTYAEVECMAFLQLPEAKTYAGLGEDLGDPFPITSPVPPRVRSY